MHERMEAFEADKHRTAKELHRMNLVTSEQHWRLDDLWTDYKMPKQYRDNVADPMPQLEVVMVSLHTFTILGNLILSTILCDIG